MNVLMTCTEFPPGPGGIGTHAYQLAAGLDALGWTVTVVTPQDYVSPEDARRFNEAQGFRVVRLRPVSGRGVEAVYRESVLARWIRRSRPDVLLASGGNAVILAAGRWAGRAIPWLAVGHGSEFGGPRGWQNRLTLSAFRAATAVACVSEYTRGRMLAAGVRPRIECVIPNGADPGQFGVRSVDSAALRRALGLPAGPLLVTVGNVTERKGQDVVVRALPRILERVRDAQYAVVGLPTRGAELRRLAAELGVEDRVHLLGRLDGKTLVDLLNDADVFVMTSRRTADGDVEGYGIAAVEAALCGKPSVVSSDSGLQEAIEPGKTGIAVPPNDADAAARALTSLLEDPPLRKRMGDAARTRAEREQTWAIRVCAYDALLRDLARSVKIRRTDRAARAAL